MPTASATAANEDSSSTGKHSATTLSPQTHGRKWKAPPNMVVRAITIAIGAPLLLLFGMSSKYAASVIVFFGIFVGGIEWSGLKRHLKVALLIGNSDISSAEAARASGPHTHGPSTDDSAAVNRQHLLHPDEYPLPIVPLTFYSVLKHFSWALLSVVALFGERAFVVTFILYFLTFVSVTLTAHNGLEMRMGEAVAKLSAQRPLLLNIGSSDSLKAAQRKHFLALELRMIAERQPTEQFLDFCLDIFGIMWIAGAAVTLFVYPIPAVGIPWIFSTMVGNFANDIFALVVGRSLNRLRMHYKNAEEKSGASSSHRGVLKRFLMNGPHPLYSAISPNKSSEGATAGILANALTFTSCMLFFHYRAMPPEDVISSRFLTVPIWLLIGTVMGVLGVIGDLLQSLLKRSAHVKDAGFIIPGHGGVLDRIDGLLLVLPFMYCVVSVLMALSAGTSSA